MSQHFIDEVSLSGCERTSLFAEYGVELVDVLHFELLLQLRKLAFEKHLSGARGQLLVCLIPFVSRGRPDLIDQKRLTHHLLLNRLGQQSTQQIDSGKVQLVLRNFLIRFLKHLLDPGFHLGHQIDHQYRRVTDVGDDCRRIVT